MIMKIVIIMEKRIVVASMEEVLGCLLGDTAVTLHLHGAVRNALYAVLLALKERVGKRKVAEPATCGFLAMLAG